MPSTGSGAQEVNERAQGETPPPLARQPDQVQNNMPAFKSERQRDAYCYANFPMI